MKNKNASKVSPKSNTYDFFKKVYERFLKIRGEPKQIALGFALGLFVGMTPALGFHMVIAIFLATLFKWNKISAALAVWITNPLTAPVIYSITYMLGAKVLGLRKSYEPTSEEVTSSVFIDMLNKTPEIFAAMTIGGIIIGLPLSCIGGYIAYTIISRYQADLKKKLTQHRLKHRIKKALRKERRKQKRLNRERGIQMDKNKTQQKYECPKCNQIKQTDGSKDSAPECCGTPMALVKELPVCQSTATAEHARSDEMMEPCDDGRQGKI